MLGGCLWRWHPSTCMPFLFRWYSVRLVTVNPLSTEFHFCKSFWSYGYLVWSIFPLLMWWATSYHWAKDSSINSLRVHDLSHTHSLEAYTGQHSPTSQHFSWLKTVYSARNGVPTKAEEWFLCPFMLKEKREWSRQCTATYLVHSMSHLWPTFPYPTLFASTKLH